MKIFWRLAVCAVLFGCGGKQSAPTDLLTAKKPVEGLLSLPEQAGNFKREAVMKADSAPFGIPVDTQVCSYVAGSSRVTCNYAETTDWAPEGSGAGPGSILGNMMSAVEKAEGKIAGRGGSGDIVSAWGSLSDGRQVVMWMNGSHLFVLTGGDADALFSLCKAFPF